MIFPMFNFNKAFKCNRKVIIPLYAFSKLWNEWDVTGIKETLSDIEKAMNYLDCGRTEGSDMIERLTAAKEMGFPTLDGLSMLLLQGKEAYRLFTGENPDLNVMRRALEKGLNLR